MPRCNDGKTTDRVVLFELLAWRTQCTLRSPSQGSRLINLAYQEYGWDEVGDEVGVYDVLCGTISIHANNIYQLRSRL
jgi:hypothetical protein